MVDVLQMVTVFYVVDTVALQVLVQYAEPLLAVILLFGAVDCVLCGWHSSITSAGAVCPVLACTYPPLWFCVTDRNSSVRFEVVTAVLLRIHVFQDVTFCCWVCCRGVAKNLVSLKHFELLAKCPPPHATAQNTWIILLLLLLLLLFCYSLSKAVWINHCHWTVWLQQCASI